MPGPKDSFDPTWKMPNPDDSVAGSYDQPGTAPSGDQRSAMAWYKGDGTKQIRSAANTKNNSTVNSTPTSGPRKYPTAIGGKGGVDTFDGVRLAAPAQDKRLKHAKFEDDNQGA